MDKVRQILFVPPAPIIWAEHLGAFRDNGIEVDTTQTLSSDQIGQGLADGTWDVGIAVMDNVIAWNAERSAGLQIVAQLERSTVMRFCCVPEYGTLADAAAGTIAVDFTTNGFVLVLYRALARAGLDWRKCRSIRWVASVTVSRRWPPARLRLQSSFLPSTRWPARRASRCCGTVRT